MPLVSFYDLMMFSRVIEKDQSHEMGLWLFLEITKRERQRERQRETETERQRETETERDRERERADMLVNTTKMKIAYRN